MPRRSKKAVNVSQDTCEVKQIIAYRVVKGQEQVEISWVGYITPTWEKITCLPEPLDELLQTQLSKTKSTWTDHIKALADKAAKKKENQQKSRQKKEFAAARKESAAASSARQDHAQEQQASKQAAEDADDPDTVRKSRAGAASSQVIRSSDSDEESDKSFITEPPTGLGVSKRKRLAQGELACSLVILTVVC